MTKECEALIALIRQGKLRSFGAVGRRYQCQQPSGRFRECMVFYLDGRIHFERWCYGEAAGLSGEAWCRGMDPEGTMTWQPGKKELVSAVQEAPKRLTGGSGDGSVLFFDDSPVSWQLARDLPRDRENGYSGLGLLWRRIAPKGK